MALSVTAIAVATRTFDLYYVQPWTGIPSRYCRTTVSSIKPSPLDSVARSKKDLDSDDGRGTDSNVRKGGARQNDGADTFLMWDMERFRIEMWAPLRRMSGQTTSPTRSTRLRWQDLVPTFVFYTALVDLDIFLLSFFTDADLQGLATPQYVLFMAGIGIFIMGQILGVCLTVAIVYSLTTGQTINTSEWAMLESKLPCFARTPVEFWISWQSLFRYLWVDLGFLPMRRLCESHLGPERVGVRAAKAAREVLPILAVFTLSGILHAYTVYAVWREPVWSQMFYFMTQGIAVVLTKAVDRTPFGITVRDMYNKGGPAAKLCMRGLAMALMVVYHTATLPMFVEPYRRHNMWIELKQRSVLWWMFGK
ncbi:hypothetical protein BGZ58_005555 [Dissophora ornata]|nr:hypothetical protein BGZ58_005555 [Dissophora ornata]